MKLIPLTKGKTTVVDDTDFEWLSRWKWYALKVRGSDKFYAAHSTGGRKSHRTILMHRLLLAGVDGKQIDHRDGDGLNNTDANLRVATHSNNQHNKPAYKNNTSGFKGVCWNKAEGMWKAQISVDGKNRHLGNFSDKHEAASVYQEAAKMLHGEFANVG
jgi:hypothetical protein